MGFSVGALGAVLNIAVHYEEKKTSIKTAFACCEGASLLMGIRESVGQLGECYKPGRDGLAFLKVALSNP